MERERALGRELHVVSNLLDRRMNSIISANGAEDITPVHGIILGYLEHRRELGQDVYQKDIEAEFDITRSTVASTLKLMEKKGYLRRVGVAHDARLKRIELTPEGSAAHERIYVSIRQTEKLLQDTLTPAEYQTMLELLGKMKEALL